MAKRRAGAKTRAQSKTRSPKAPRPNRAAGSRPAVKRRQRSATVAVKKDTTLMQTDAGTRVAWGDNQPRPKHI